jgi:sec-independent protein translocase protein TatA
MFAQGFQTAGILGLSGQETLIILGVAVLLFGGKKIPELAKGMGEGIKNFKAAMKEEDSAAPKDAPAAKKDEPEEARK